MSKQNAWYKKRPQHIILLLHSKDNQGKCQGKNEHLWNWDVIKPLPFLFESALHDHIDI